MSNMLENVYKEVFFIVDVAAYYQEVLAARWANFLVEVKDYTEIDKQTLADTLKTLEEDPNYKAIEYYFEDVCRTRDNWDIQRQMLDTCPKELHSPSIGLRKRLKSIFGTIDRINDERIRAGLNGNVTKEAKIS